MDAHADDYARDEEIKCVVYYSIPEIIDGKLYTKKIPFKYFDSPQDAQLYISASKLERICMCGYTDVETFDSIYKDKSFFVS